MFHSELAMWLADMLLTLREVALARKVSSKELNSSFPELKTKKSCNLQKKKQASVEIQHVKLPNTHNCFDN